MFWALRLILDGRKYQLHLAQICHCIPNNQRVVVLQIHLNGGAQIRALGEQNKMLQLEDALDNLGLLLGTHDLHAQILTNRSLLLRKITHTAEHEI